MLQWFRSLADRFLRTGRKRWCVRSSERACDHADVCAWKGHGTILLALAAGTDERRAKWTEEFSSPGILSRSERSDRMIGESSLRARSRERVLNMQISQEGWFTHDRSRFTHGEPRRNCTSISGREFLSWTMNTEKYTAVYFSENYVYSLCTES